jgi:class 3 adenylate cyclase
MRTSTIQLIAGLFPELTPEELAVIEAGISEAAADYVEFARGQSLDPSKKRDQNLWIVTAGKFVVFMDDVYISELGPGSLVGEEALLESGPALNIAISADRPSAALRIPRSTWDRLRTRPDQSAAWHRLVVLNLSRKLADTTARYINNVQAESEKERLLRMFVSDFSLGHVKASLHGDAGSYKTVHALLWFSDIEGFSTQVSALDPSEAGRVTRALLQVQADKLAAAGAQLDKFMGDGMMSYWICDEPILPDDVAREAVEAAFTILSEVRRSSIELGVNVDLRIGMHYGAAIAGNFGSEGRIAHTLIGSNVNLAARYEQVRGDAHQAAIGAIRISPVVFSVLGNELQGRFAGPALCPVKHGLHIPVHHATA